MRTGVQILSTHMKNHVLLCTSVSLALWEAGTGEPVGSAGCRSSSRFRERPYLKEIKQRIVLQDTGCLPLASTHTCAYTEYIHVHSHIIYIW